MANFNPPYWPRAPNPRGYGAPRNPITFNEHSVIFQDMAKDTNWDSPVSKRWIQINSDSWIWLSDIMSLVKHRKGRPHVTQINTGSTCQQKSYRDGVQPQGAHGGPVAAQGLPLSWAGWSCGEQTFRTALVNMPMVSTHPELCLCPFQLNVLGATKLTSDGLLLICSGGIRDWDVGFLSQYINVWAIFTVSVGIIYSLDTMTLIFFLFISLQLHPLQEKKNNLVIKTELVSLRTI